VAPQPTAKQGQSIKDHIFIGPNATRNSGRHLLTKWDTAQFPQIRDSKATFDDSTGVVELDISSVGVSHASNLPLHFVDQIIWRYANRMANYHLRLSSTTKLATSFIQQCGPLTRLLKHASPPLQPPSRLRASSSAWVKGQAVSS
jgi:hypothetical protein